MITTASVIERLYADRDFTTYLNQQARRHFSNTTDRQEAVEEAWARVCSHLSYQEFQRIAFRAMQNLYKRNSRRAGHEDAFQTVD